MCGTGHFRGRRHHLERLPELFCFPVRGQLELRDFTTVVPRCPGIRRSGMVSPRKYISSTFGADELKALYIPQTEKIKGETPFYAKTLHIYPSLFTAVAL